MELNQEIIDMFIGEFRENIEGAIHSILMLEKNPSDTESIHDLFRKFHTIKGNADVGGFEKIVRLSHEAETLLDNIREQAIEVNSQIIETLLISADALTVLVDEVEGMATFDEHELNALIKRLSSHLPPERPHKRVEGDQLAPDGPLAFYLQIVDEASQIFDQIVSMAMSGRFNSVLPDIHEKTARLSKSIEDAFYPKASNLLNLFQNYMTVIRTHDIPFSQQNFALLKDLFLAFIDSLMAELSGMLGIRLVTTADLFREDGSHPHHEYCGKDARTSPLYCMIDLSGNEDLDRDKRARVETMIQDLRKAFPVMALIDPLKRAVVEPDTPSFVSSIEALYYIIEAIGREVNS